VGDLLQRALPGDTLVVAIDPGKAQNRVWLSTDAAGLLVEPLVLPVLAVELTRLGRVVQQHRGARDPVIAIEATGALHRAWVTELDRLFPRSVRLFVPSETSRPGAVGLAASKTDDRNYAALTYLARQGLGRAVLSDEHEAGL